VCAHLVGHEGSQVALLGWVITRERADLTKVLLGALLGQETQGTTAGSLKFTVRHADRRGLHQNSTQQDDTNRYCQILGARVLSELRELMPQKDMQTAQNYCMIAAECCCYDSREQAALCTRHEHHSAFSCKTQNCMLLACSTASSKALLCQLAASLTLTCLTQAERLCETPHTKSCPHKNAKPNGCLCGDWPEAASVELLLLALATMQFDGASDDDEVPKVRSSLIEAF
jgi:hypothetical protein